MIPDISYKRRERIVSARSATAPMGVAVFPLSRPLSPCDPDLEMDRSENFHES